MFAERTARQSVHLRVVIPTRSRGSLFLGLGNQPGNWSPGPLDLTLLDLQHRIRSLSISLTIQHGAILRQLLGSSRATLEQLRIVDASTTPSPFNRDLWEAFDGHMNHLTHLSLINIYLRPPSSFNFTNLEFWRCVSLELLVHVQTRDDPAFLLPFIRCFPNVQQLSVVVKTPVDLPYITRPINTFELYALQDLSISAAPETIWALLTTISTPQLTNFGIRLLPFLGEARFVPQPANPGFAPGFVPQPAPPGFVAQPPAAAPNDGLPARPKVSAIRTVQEFLRRSRPTLRTLRVCDFPVNECLELLHGQQNLVCLSLRLCMGVGRPFSDLLSGWYCGNHPSVQELAYDGPLNPSELRVLLRWLQDRASALERPAFSRLELCSLKVDVLPTTQAEIAREVLVFAGEGGEVNRESLKGVFDEIAQRARGEAPGSGV